MPAGWPCVLVKVIEPAPAAVVVIVNDWVVPSGRARLTWSVTPGWNPDTESVKLSPCWPGFGDHEAAGFSAGGGGVVVVVVVELLVGVVLVVVVVVGVEVVVVVVGVVVVGVVVVVVVVVVGVVVV